MNKRLMILLFAVSVFTPLWAQEAEISGFELSIDQDYFADFLRDKPYTDRNYTIGLRIGMYGELADHPYLGLPWVRNKVDEFLVDKLLYGMGFRQDKVSHNFAFTINGFSPLHISNQTSDFNLALADGYNLSEDRPFSSFTGFRSTRRIEGNKLFVHSAKQLDLAINTSFTFGFASLGFAEGLENLFGDNRPDGNLWEKNDTLPYPSGQVLPAPLPLFMYSLSVEAVVWRPMRQVVLQLRPELNLGYYTNFGIGLDFGKVLNVERHVDNLSYTDTNNPGILVVSNQYLAFSIVAGGTARCSCL